MRSGLALLVFWHAAGAAVAQETPADGDAVSQARIAAEFAVAEAKRYRLLRADDAAAGEAELAAGPLLRWSDPQRAEVHGSVVLWTRGGCPEAVGSIYRYFDQKKVDAELVSLSESPLTVERNGRVRWTPEAGVTFRPLPGGPTPADSPEKRSLQARAVAQRFSGTLMADPTTNHPLELRLMARPLARYEATDGSGREGAVFAFVATTDPEILLLIESRPTAAGREWRYAAARLHFAPLELALRGERVWDAPRLAPPWDAIRGPAGSYVILEWPSPEAAARD